MASNAAPWATAPLTALDLEGSGAQDREDEAILEIAVIPLAIGLPDMSAAYCTLINPGRPIPKRPWISPGLTTTVLSDAPEPGEVEPELARRINGRIIVGHNIGVDWRLLRRCYPRITPAGLVDTLRLARHLKLGGKNSLSALIAQVGIAAQVEQLAPASQPHRALWDTTATALLLPALISAGWPAGITLGELLDIARFDMTKPSGFPQANNAQDTLFD
jgi:DNA polymerase-3 subunit epsilon